MVVGLTIGLALVWGAAFWEPIAKVYQDRWLPKEDWRGVATFIKASGCPDTHYWTYLGSHYSYGFGYYVPSVIPRSHILNGLPSGSYASSSVVDAVARQPLGAETGSSSRRPWRRRWRPTGGPPTPFFEGSAGRPSGFMD